MTAVPAKTPVTDPEEEPTVATLINPELHVPPGEASAKVVIAPTQIPEVPVIGETEFTVIILVT